MQYLIIISSMMTALGLAILVIPSIIERYRIFCGGIPINASVHERKEMQRKGKKYIKLTWRYEYEGKEYFAKARYWMQDDGRDIGHKGAVLVRRDDPESVYDFMPKYQRDFVKIFGIIITSIGFIMILISLFMRSTISLLI